MVHHVQTCDIFCKYLYLRNLSFQLAILCPEPCVMYTFNEKIQHVEAEVEIPGVIKSRWIFPIKFIPGLNFITECKNMQAV